MSDQKTQTTPNFIEMKLYVMERMPLTGHLISDEGIPKFYDGIRKEATDDQVEAFAESYGVLPNEKLRHALTTAIRQGGNL